MIAGDVVLLRFPFSDLSGAKLRPVLALVVLDSDDFIAVQITSKQKRGALELAENDFNQGGLRTVSFVLPGKLFTADQKIIVKRVGRLKDAVREKIKDAVIQILRKT